MRCINCTCELPTPPKSTANKYDDWCDDCWIAVPQKARWPKTNQAELNLIEQDRIRQEKKKLAKRQKVEEQKTTKSKEKGKKEKPEKLIENPELWDYEDS